MSATDSLEKAIEASRFRALLPLFFGPPPQEIVRHIEAMESYAQGEIDNCPLWKGT